MKISIDNLGPIKHADIDLDKDLIILCGANNTGKTYLAYSVYGLFKFGEKMVLHFEDEVEEEEVLADALQDDEYNEWDLSQVFLLNKEPMTHTLQAQYADYLPTVFAAERAIFKEVDFLIGLDEETIIQKIFACPLIKNITLEHGTTLKIEKTANSHLLHVSVRRGNKGISFSYKKMTRLVGETMFSFMVSTIFTNVHIETAERAAINLFSKEMTEKRSKLIDIVLEGKEKINTLDFIQKQASRYSLPIKDSLNLANRMDVLQKQKSPFAYLAEEIEKSILQGKIKVADTGEVQFSPHKSKKNFGVHLTASVVKSLASIVFYLRHIAQPNDLFIIDEPELNLHPDNQRKVARVIAQMANAGIKVMLSTHSDYIIRELNNLIMLGTKDNEKTVNKLIKKYGYKKEQVLSPEKVGVYLFTDKVEALEVSATGFEVKSIDDEINALNESSQDIFFTLYLT